ncbi:hypothetical protein [Candidatus Thiosymbion oneisti]|uniref:hypothetical protein n=1 Tax=Candidatus Thiosymbion oneisti TaxID=589554 RepID=UPI000B3342E9|nr:hypothetical protein [Candidatus Thiosymbion oneisti]
MKNPVFLSLLFAVGLVGTGLSPADIPATPVMTLYKFNGKRDLPYYEIESFRKQGPSSPAGTLAQGTSLIPCLVIRDGQALTDEKGTPYVGFRILVDPRRAVPTATDKFKRAFAQRKSMRVANHHCDGRVRHVIRVRQLYALNKAPFFDPPGSGRTGRIQGARNKLDEIIRTFHDSSHCADANRKLSGRRQALNSAWGRFIADHRNQWSEQTIAQAKHLDYTMRTAIYEGHLDRGCNTYGACERNIIALSIRNRGRAESCLKRQGCRFPGDYQGVSSKVSQYNIWDEYLTQISGLTSCFLRSDLSSGKGADYYAKIRAMYEQNLGDVQRILFGNDRDLQAIFHQASLSDVKALRHYYHAPAMGKCFPNYQRVEYMSGAVARKGTDFALIANTRIQVGNQGKNGYRFREFLFEEASEKDLIRILDNYPGFEVDARKVSLKSPSACPPYGIPRGCNHRSVGRYRRTPPWLESGKALGLQCKIRDRGTNCRGRENLKAVTVGGTCDTQMRPVTRVH